MHLSIDTKQSWYYTVRGVGVKGSHRVISFPRKRQRGHGTRFLLFGPLVEPGEDSFVPEDRICRLENPVVFIGEIE